MKHWKKNNVLSIQNSFYCIPSSGRPRAAMFTYFHFTAHKLISKLLRTPIYIFLADLKKKRYYFDSFNSFLLFSKLLGKLGMAIVVLAVVVLFSHNLRKRGQCSWVKSQVLVYVLQILVAHGLEIADGGPLMPWDSLLSSFVLVMWWVKVRKKGRKRKR